jgi:error-prone DNA polymerase
LKNGAKVAAAGVVLVRQRPGTAKGIIFMTLEDETGVTNVVVWPKAFETYRKVVMGSRLILVRGRIQAHDGVLHVVSDRLEDHSIMLHQLADAIVDTSPDATDNAAKQLAHANPRRHPRNVRIIPGSRDFH